MKIYSKQWKVNDHGFNDCSKDEQYQGQSQAVEKLPYFLSVSTLSPLLRPHPHFCSFSPAPVIFPFLLVLFPNPAKEPRDNLSNGNLCINKEATGS